MDPTRLLRITECARRRGVCRETIYSAIARGDLVAVRVGNGYRVPAEALESWRPLSPREIGRLGGLATHDTDFYQRIGEMGGKVSGARVGELIRKGREAEAAEDPAEVAAADEGMTVAQAGHLGGTETLARHGPEYFAALTKAGHARAQELAATGRQVEVAEFARDAAEAQR